MIYLLIRATSNDLSGCFFVTFLLDHAASVFASIVFFLVLLTLTTKFNMPTPLRSNFKSGYKRIIKNLFERKGTQKQSSFQWEKIDSRLKSSTSNGLYFSFYVLIIITIYVLLPGSNQHIINFLTSFSSSLVQDMFLFSVLGFGLAYLSLKKPEDEEKSQRIKYLLNNREVEPSIRDAIFNRVLKHLIYCEKMEVRIIFLEDCETLDAVRIEAYCTKNYINPIKDMDVVDYPHEFRLMTDKLAIDDGLHPTHNCNGQIYEISILREGDLPPMDVHDLPLSTDSEVMKKVTIECPKGGKFTTSSKIWVWYKVGMDYIWRTDRYTKYFELKLENKSKKNIKIKSINAMFKNKGSKSSVHEGEISLTNGEVKAYFSEELDSGDHNLFNLVSIER